MGDDRCRDCGSLLRWATTSGGFRKPFELEPSAGGEWLLNYAEACFGADGEIVPGEWRAEWVSQAFRREAVLHAMHRDACTDRTEEGAA